MKTGFSSLACPAWDLNTIISNAVSFGFDGVELRGLRGELHLPLVPELARNPERVAELFADAKVELVCLGTSATLDSKDARDIAHQKGLIMEFAELAARLGCPNVRLFVGEVQKWDNHRAALARIAEALKGLAPIADRHEVNILVENGGDFAGSDDIWFLLDALRHPRIRCCWNQCNARTARERPTTSIPRLGRKLGLVHICDGSFDEVGTLLEYRVPGQGDVEIERQIDLLRGVVYEGYLIFEWPKLWVETLPAPESVLPGVAKFLRQCIEKKDPVLTAYKGDKQAPRIPGRAGAAPTPKSAKAALH